MQKCGRRGTLQRSANQQKRYTHWKKGLVKKKHMPLAQLRKRSSFTQVLVTLRINNQHNVMFEIDTGASCNILPFSEYVKATGDKDGVDIKQVKTWLTMDNNTSEPHTW